MEHKEMVLRPIGIACTSYGDMDAAPFQGCFSDNRAVVEIHGDYAAGLKDVEMAGYLIVLYWAHLADRGILQTVTPWGPEIRGVFACRSSARPNPISICVVELLERDGNRLTVRGLDAVDVSAILDIIPYSSAIDAVAGAGIKWFEEREGRRGDGTAAG